MSSDTPAWRPLDPSSLPAAASLTDVAAILRSAVEEAMSAERSAPVRIAGIEVAELDAASETPSAHPVATVELLGAPRRVVLAAVDAAEGDDAGSALDPVATGSGVLRAVDAAVATVAGEGIGIGPADAAELPAQADRVAIRLTFEADGRPLGRLVFVAEAAIVGELAAHVAALRALDAAAAETEAAPTESARPAAGGDSPSSAATAPHGGSPETAPTVGAAGPEIRPVAFAELGGSGTVGSAPEPPRSLDLLLGVQLQVSVEIGRAKLPIRDVLALAPGSIVELDKLAGEKADILVNGHPVAQGEVVVVDENFGVRITDVVSRQRRILSVDGAA